MAELLYKTLGGVSPKGKPRVYFTCHSQDFRGCFQELTDEILKISDCAIYYYAEEPAPDEDYYLNLSQMQLFVMPVTSRLLYMPCRAMDVDFPYAMEHHIPVLPLMQEQDLERRFNEKCGDLQFLDKHNSDPTAIPYDEKLKKYLGAVLVGDELAAQVRAAFDAYVFLSYRKKDRKFAQELMRLLHRDPRCRDIAIWYDEFLTPGENFNDSIREALEKSGLFVLAVTPNLVNEINYIMTTEYPMAKDAGKPILPAEMQPTDPDALRDHYDGIPDTVDPQEEGVLTDAVLDALRNLAIRENDDPRHNFFIGLAYLSGIDVEVDHEYAVKLITSAAESGLTEAMEKLVSMYESGVGVQRDYDTAISWREKLVEQARRQYETSQDETDGFRYYHRVDELRQVNSDVQYTDRALALCEDMKRIAARLVQQCNTWKARRLLVTAYKKAGDTLLDEKRYQEAKEQYIEAVSLMEALYRDEPRTQTKRLLASAYRDLAVVYREIGRGPIYKKGEELIAAEKWFRMAQTHIEELAQKDETPETQEALAHIYLEMVELSDMLMLLDEKCQSVSYEERVDYSAKAVIIVETLVRDRGFEKYNALLCKCYKVLGMIDLTDNTLTWRLRYLNAAEVACQRSESISSLRLLVDAHYMLAVHYVDRYRSARKDRRELFEQAQNYLLRGTKNAKQLITQTNADKDKLTLVDFLMEISKLLMDAGPLQVDKHRIEIVLQEAERSVSEIMKNDPGIPRRLKLAEIIQLQARLKTAAGHHAWAEYKYKRALQIVDEILETEKTEEALGWASDLCHNLFELLRDGEKRNEAGFWLHREWEYEQMQDLSKVEGSDFALFFLTTEEPKVPADTRPPVPLEQDVELYERMMNELFPSKYLDEFVSLDDLFADDV